MSISRRGFLECAAGASAAGVASATGLGSLLPEISREPSGCVLVDSGAVSSLRESAAGYASALSSLNVTWHRISINALATARMVILPAGVDTGPPLLASLREQLLNGALVLYETGAAFLGPEEFTNHKRVIRSGFGVSLHDPVRLWESADSFKQSPYVDYHWPVVTKVRDFSRVIPVSGENGEAIAWFQKLPVGFKRRVGKGTLVFLGSPLGPHLLSADREAGSLLRALCSSC